MSPSSRPSSLSQAATILRETSAASSAVIDLRMSGSALTKACASQACWIAARGRSKPGIADEEAVIGFRHARRRDHRVAPAVRAAEHVGKVGLAAVMRGDDRLGDRRKRHVGRIAVVAPRLRIEAEGRAGGEAEAACWPDRARVAAVRATEPRSRAPAPERRRKQAPWADRRSRAARRRRCRRSPDPETARSIRPGAAISNPIA